MYGTSLAHSTGLAIRPNLGVVDADGISVGWYSSGTPKVGDSAAAGEYWEGSRGNQPTWSGWELAAVK